MRIFVVEDEPKVAWALQEGLEAESYSVALAHMPLSSRGSGKAPGATIGRKTLLVAFRSPSRRIPAVIGELDFRTK